MIHRDAIVLEARSWLGVPFRHQGRTRSGTDCGGLLGAVAIGARSVDAEWWAQEFDPHFAGYGRHTVSGSLRSVCDRFMSAVPLPQAAPGDAVLLRIGPEQEHVGILADYAHGGLSIVHALSTVGRVVEHRLAFQLRWRLLCAYRFPGVI